MKWYGWTLVGMLIAGLIALYFYDLSTVNYLKGRITVLEAHRDTFYVQGAVDTILIKKTYRDTLIAYKQEPLDTVINMGDHTVGLATKDSLLFVDLECRKPELIITKIDTIYRIKEILKPVECVEKFSYKDFGIGTLTGISTVLLIYTLIGNK